MATPEEQRPPWIPKPKTTADFIVVVFVGIIAIVLLGFTAAAIWQSVVQHEDVGSFVSLITDLMTTLIAALVGYIAGRSMKNGNGNGHE